KTVSKNHAQFLRNNNLNLDVVKLEDGRIKLINSMKDIFDKIMVYNRMEELNCQRFNFIPILYNQCDTKEYTYETVELKSKKKQKKKDFKISEFDIEKIVNAYDISKSNINNI